ncbi:MAG: hypothetical protein QW096_12890, partial [Thermofilaceae archaeon]
YCKRLIISTRAGVFHMDARAWEDYIPLEYVGSTGGLEKIVEASYRCIENMFRKIIERHASNAFKLRILDVFNDFMRKYECTSST